MRLFARAGLGILSMISPAAAASMTNDMDLVYGRYQMAIYAAQLCRGAPDDDAAWRKWSSFLDAQTNHELGAGERLSLIEGVKRDVIYLVRRQGCDSPSVQDLLALYDSELGPLLKK
ncbi:hypothetical protein [Dongia sp.]|uniref:hypothetical protein n=1 Tax=Dongia sp. TaxID=1977262 RepID=UPI00375109A7